MEQEHLNIIIDILNSGISGVVTSTMNELIVMVNSSHSGSISTLSFQALNDKKKFLLDLCSKPSKENSKKIHDIVSAATTMGVDEVHTEIEFQEMLFLLMSGVNYT